jgi:hypothetical protein
MGMPCCGISSVASYTRLSKVVAWTLASVAGLVLLAFIVHRAMGYRDTQSRYAKFAVQNLGSKVEMFKEDVGRYPRSLDELTLANPVPGSQGPYARMQELVDPWERPYFYRTWDSTFTVFTLGDDGRPGGTGEAVDHQYDPNHPE